MSETEVREPADPQCRVCHGTGVVIDWVPRPFGPGNVRMESVCDCVEAVE